MLGNIRNFFEKKSAIEMWKRRARQYGPLAVLDIGHTAEEMETVTQLQKDKIFPFLYSELTGNERTVLDLGCGIGRFTSDLAAMIEGKALGVDPVKDFIKAAPAGDNVKYSVMKEGRLPAGDESFDIVWICLVLGGVIREKILKKTVSEVDRVLRPGGLVMVIENTTDAPDTEYWKFRSVSFYQSLFKFAKLKHLSDYYDLGERISIMTGRKQQ